MLVLAAATSSLGEGDTHARMRVGVAVFFRTVQGAEWSFQVGLFLRQLLFLVRPDFEPAYVVPGEKRRVLDQLSVKPVRTGAGLIRYETDSNSKFKFELKK